MPKPESTPAPSSPPPVLLSPEQLSARWGGRVSVKTLQNWRYQKPAHGPKASREHPVRGSPIVYRLEDVEQWEAAERKKAEEARG